MQDVVVVSEAIDARVLRVRGHRVMVDADLAGLYGVESKRLAEQVRRNPERFPPDFMFHLSRRERDAVIAIRPDLRRLKSSRTMPRAFTEHGALMLASVLNSEVAVRVSIEVVRTFVRMREAVATQRVLAEKVDQLEQRYDSQFKDVFDAIRELMEPPAGPENTIGFRNSRS